MLGVLCAEGNDEGEEETEEIDEEEEFVDEFVVVVFCCARADAAARMKLWWLSKRRRSTHSSHTAVARCGLMRVCIFSCSSAACAVVSVYCWSVCPSFFPLHSFVPLPRVRGSRWSLTLAYVEEALSVSAIRVIPCTDDTTISLRCFSFTICAGIPG